MPGLTKADLGTLITKRPGFCVSIYMPTERPGGDTKQNPIRLKNMLHEAEVLLVEGGLRSPEAIALLAPAGALLDDSLFWVDQLDGLAVFVSEDVFKVYRQPVRFEPQVSIGNRFSVKPMIPLLTGDGRFYVLAVSQKDVRLLRGTHFTVDQVEVEEIPHSLRDALKYDEYEEQVQSHVPGQMGYGRRMAIFHGQGVGEDDTKEEIFRYFRQIDQGLNEILAESRAPLVVAGVEYLHPIYASANTYAGLLPEGIRGNPDDLSNADLHGRAWAIVKPVFEAEQREALETFGAVTSSGRSSSGLRDVVSGAYAGRVDTLFVAGSTPAWGTFDRQSGDIDLHAERMPESEDLVELAVVHTLTNNGRVYALADDAMPNGGPVAAVFRY